MNLNNNLLVEEEKNGNITNKYNENSKINYKKNISKGDKNDDKIGAESVIVNNTNGNDPRKNDSPLKNMMGMFSDQNSDLIKILNADESVKKELTTINEKSKELTLDITSEIDDMKKKQDEEWSKTEKEIKDKLNNNDLTDALMAKTETELTELLSTLIVKMDKDGNISQDDLNDYFAQISHFIDEKDNHLSLPKDDKNNLIKYSQSRDYIEKISRDFKRLKNDRNADYANMRNVLSNIIFVNKTTYDSMSFFELLLRSFIDYFRTIASCYENLHNAVFILDKLANKMIYITRQYEDTEDQKTKDRIAREAIQCMSSIKHIVMSLDDLPEKTLDSIDDIEKLIKNNFTLEKTNVKNLAVDIMGIIGSDMTKKAFEEARKQQGNSVSDKKNLLLNLKIKDMKKKYEAQSQFLAQNFIGIDTSTVDELAKQTEIDKEEIDKIMSGSIGETKKLTKNKCDKEAIALNAKYKANNYIINKTEIAENTIGIIKEKLKEFEQNYQHCLDKYNATVQELISTREDGNMQANISYLDNLIKMIEEGKTKLTNFKKSVKDMLYVPDKKSEYKKKIEDEKKIVDTINNNLDDWLKKNQDDKKKDKLGCVATLEEIKGYQSSIDNAKEIKFNGYDEIEKDINKNIKNLNDFSYSITHQKLLIFNKGGKKSKIDVYKEETKNIRNDRKECLKEISRIQQLFKNGEEQRRN